MQGAYTMEELAEGPALRVDQILICQAAELAVQKVLQEQADAKNK